MTLRDKKQNKTNKKQKPFGIMHFRNKNYRQIKKNNNDNHDNNDPKTVRYNVIP